MAEFQCVIVTPEATAIDCMAEFIAVPLYDGEKGIGAHHSPMIGRLGFGELRIRSRGKETRHYVDGGFVQVADNVVSVLTNRAVPAGKVDIDSARSQLQDAIKLPSNTEDLQQVRERQIQQARGQIHVARRANE